MKITKRKVVSGIVAAAMAVGLAIGGAAAAQAITENVGDTIQTGTVYQYWTLRTTTRQSQATQRPIAGTQGGTLVLGMRRSSTGVQFARAEAPHEVTRSFTTDAGSVWLPQGGFYLNVKSTGACGGSGCGWFHWESVFAWNL